MTSWENLEPWNFMPTFADSWLSEAFARDTDILTRALQQSLSDNSDFVTGDDAFSPLLNMVKPETTSSSSLQTPSVSGSDPETPASKRLNGVSNRKISKRKSRASKRSTTTFITADPTNFRQMVQQVTGVKFGAGQRSVSAVLKPEPQRAFNRFQGCLPTLDTSAFLLDHHQQAAGPTPTAIANGHPLDDSVELLLDTCPEFFTSHDREFHVATLPYKPEFKVMPEGWDGTTRDPDEVHYEISMKEDEMLYQEFVQKMNFNKMKMAKEIKCHKYSRRRPSDGWNFMVEKMGPRGKRGNGGGWKFISVADGSSRPLNELEKMFVKRETPRRRRKILP